MADHNEGLLKLRVDNVVWRQVGDEVMILDTESSEYLSVNRTGSALWSLLQDGATVKQLVDVLVDRFEVDESTATADAMSFLSSLDSRGLLERPAQTERP